eukprot:COSAG01_NODE_2064_length_8507_cov_312.247740_4_plen_200_part_00
MSTGLFVNSSHDDFVASSTRADKCCPEGFSFTGTGLAAGLAGVGAEDSEALTLCRLCVLKLFMPPWFGLEPLTTPRYTPAMLNSRQRFQGIRRGPRQPLPIAAPTAEERSYASHLLCGRCHPDSWVESQPSEVRGRCQEMLALPVCTGPRVMLGRVFDCACFAMAGAECPVVAFLAHATDGQRVTARDAWLAILKNMPW